MKNTLLSCLASLSFLTASSQIHWTPIADFPSGGRYSAATFMAGDKLYASGGISAVSPVVAASDLQVYDESSNTWTAKASLPTGVNLYGASSFSIDGKGYICDGELVPGSYLYDTLLLQYDPSTDVWTRKASFPGIPGYATTSFSIGQYGYRGLSYSPYTTDFYRYDAIADQWSAIASFPGTARQSASSFVINGAAYVGLGATQGNPNTLFTDFYKYDTSTNIWSAMATFPGAGRYNAAGFAMNGKGYIVGGQGSTTYNEVWQYDPQTNAWTEMDTFPAHIGGGIAGSYASTAFAGMGEGPNNVLQSKMYRTGYATSIAAVDQNNSSIWYYNNTIHIRFEKEIADNGTFAIYDLSGREVLSEVLQKGQSSFAMAADALINGMYIYKISSGLHSGIPSGKIVISK